MRRFFIWLLIAFIIAPQIASAQSMALMHVLRYKNPAAVSGSSVTWTPETAPAMQDLAYSSSTATFSAINFGVGLGIVMVSTIGRSVTGVTVKGASATLVAEASSGGSSNFQVYQITIGSAGSKNVVVTGSAALKWVGVSTGTLTGANSTATGTSTLSYGYRADPSAAPSITVPSGGIAIGGLASETNNAATWNAGTKSVDVGIATARHTSGYLSATGAPSISGFSYAGSGMAFAAWGP